TDEPCNDNCPLTQACNPCEEPCTPVSARYCDLQPQGGPRIKNAVAIGPTGAVLDKTVLCAQAMELVPRAIAYTGSLVDYFFRGLKFQVTIGADRQSFAVGNPLAEPMTGAIIAVYGDRADERRYLYGATLGGTMVPAHGTSDPVGFDLRPVFDQLPPNGSIV